MLTQLQHAPVDRTAFATQGIFSVHFFLTKPKEISLCFKSVSQTSTVGVWLYSIISFIWRTSIHVIFHCYCSSSPVAADPNPQAQEGASISKPLRSTHRERPGREGRLLPRLQPLARHPGGKRRFVGWGGRSAYLPDPLWPFDLFNYSTTLHNPLPPSTPKPPTPTHPTKKNHPNEKKPSSFSKDAWGGQWMTDVKCSSLAQRMS